MQGVYLSLETSGPNQGSWAIMEKGFLLAAARFEGRISQELPAILAKAQDYWKGVDSILIGVGPGSYSGVRVAVATAQGIRVALGFKLIAVRSSGAVAEIFNQEEKLAVLASGRKGECVLSWYEKGRLSQHKDACKCLLMNQVEKEIESATAVVRMDSEIPYGTLVIPNAFYLAKHWMRCGSEENLALEPIHFEAISK